MATFSKQKLSGSTDGRNLIVAATATPGTSLHTAHATAWDEVWLWAINTDTTDRKLTIEWGSAAAPNNLIELTIPAEAGLMQVVPGLILTNSLPISAFASAANVVMINGYVNRITP